MLKKKKALMRVKLDGLDESFNDLAMSMLLAGNLKISWQTIRRYTDCNYTADLTANALIQRGFKILYEGKIFEKWT